MSRYYKIVVGPETQSAPGRAPGGDAPSNNAGATWTNNVNGTADLGAQQIEFDVHAYGFGTPVSPAFLRIWGPSKEQISQASDFNGAHLELSVGMQKGLPLASAAVAQAGIILSGQIFQAYGNWQGINQTLDFVVLVDGGATQAEPGKLSFTWKKGDKLEEVVQTVLQAAYPKVKLDINISPNLVLAQDEQGVYQTIEQFASYVKGVSLDILGASGTATYQGVEIVLSNDVMRVFDGTASSDGAPTPITVQDLIGQPTWLSANSIQFSTVVRSDMSIGSQVTFPPIASATAVTTQQSGSNVRSKNAFTGTWIISYIRHVGNSRAPDAQSWISTFQAYSTEATAAQTSVAATSA